MLFVIETVLKKLMFAYRNHRYHFGFSKRDLIFSTLIICLLATNGVLTTPLYLFAESKDDPKKEIVSITNKEKQVISELDKLSRTLNGARKKKSMIQKDIRSLDKHISENRLRSKQLSEQINKNETYAHKRIVALYKLHQRGKLNVLASADTLYDVFQRKQALETILQQDNQTLMSLLKNQTELGQIRQKLLDQKTQKDALEKNLNVQIVNITRKQKKRGQMLRRIRNQKALTLAAIESQKNSARELNTTISGFKKENPGNRPYSESAAQAFADLKGLLIMPVKGKIVAFFGPYTNARFKIVNFRSGINIRAERGEPIHAVYKGKTLYADWFQGYGNMIIIDHGNHYYTLYAHAEELFKKKGDLVDAGEVIATVGDTGSMDDPGLHFEVRHHGQPIDPVPWINQG
jgi:septal ring factor EnvC (AmiA/AmiB activator)